MKPSTSEYAPLNVIAVRQYEYVENHVVYIYLYTTKANYNSIKQHASEQRKPII